MATGSSCWDDPADFVKPKPNDNISKLYPHVNEAETPLPRAWSSKDKYNFIGLSQNNLRVHYKGFGKNHKDAASVKATHSIPASCGIYYYEVQIISKGRDGYMGIGLATQGVNMNRLPGWDKNSYGYHGDDGHSFFSSGTGQPYGPTFTTGDIIGCGVNLIENNCFYTKNGHYLGIAFTDLPQNIYPTVGLQTPGEIVESNFGQTPFVFDIEDMMKGMRGQIHKSIVSYPPPHTDASWQEILHKLVASYLMHQGYSSTADAFVRSTSQELPEELSSIKNRQKIQNMILTGQIGEAMKTVDDLYPGLLASNPNLLFVLKIRQFIEVINGTETEAFPSNCSRIDSSVVQHTCNSPNFSTSPSQTITNGSTAQPTSVIQSTKNVLNTLNSDIAMCTDIINDTNESNGSVVASNGSLGLCGGVNSVSSSSAASSTSQINDSDLEMDCEESFSDCHEQSTKKTYTNGYPKTIDSFDEDQQSMDIEVTQTKICGGDSSAIAHMLQLGRDLQRMSETLDKKSSPNNNNKTMLHNAFSLLAYNDPWNSPLGWQLDPVQREMLCQTLNSAILESGRLPARPALEVCVSQAKQVLKQMSQSSVAVCAFASVESFIDNTVVTNRSQKINQ